MFNRSTPCKHKFEPRYDTVETPSPLGIAMGCATRMTGAPDPDTLKLTNTIYRGDVCVKCGTTANPELEAKLKTLEQADGELAALAILAANKLGAAHENLKDKIYHLAYRE